MHPNPWEVLEPEHAPDLDHVNTKNSLRHLNSMVFPNLSPKEHFQPPFPASPSLSPKSSSNFKYTSKCSKLVHVLWVCFVILPPLFLCLWITCHALPFLGAPTLPLSFKAQLRYYLHEAVPHSSWAARFCHSTSYIPKPLCVVQLLHSRAEMWSCLSLFSLVGTCLGHGRLARMGLDGVKTFSLIKVTEIQRGSRGTIFVGLGWVVIIHILWSEISLGLSCPIYSHSLFWFVWFCFLQWTSVTVREMISYTMRSQAHTSRWTMKVA